MASTTEIHGSAIVPVVHSVNYGDIKHILSRHGLESIEPDRWYSQQRWAAALNDIGENGSGMFDLIAIGKEIVNMSPVQEGVTIEQALFSLDDAMQQAHRNGSYGSISVSQDRDRHIELVIDTPYPVDLWYGIVYQIAVNHAPSGVHPTVTYEDFDYSRSSGHANRIIVEW